MSYVIFMVVTWIFGEVFKDFLVARRIRRMRQWVTDDQWASETISWIRELRRPDVEELPLSGKISQS